MKLELSKRGDYGVRAVLALARADGQLLSGRLISAETHVPVRFLPQIMGDLARAGLVSSLPGRNGGYRLARAPETISLLAVIESIEGDGRRTTCVLRGGPCRFNGRCDVHDVFRAAQDALIDQLERTSLATIAAGPGVVGGPPEPAS